jgi:endonuclease/exonuclease/phosphatase family metal-dependent hydrolase
LVLAKAEKSRFHIFIRKVILTFNAIAVIALLLSYSAAYINPATFSPIAFAGLSYPVILAVNLAFVLFWLIVSWKYSLISILFIAAGWNNVVRLVEFHTPETPDANTKYIKIISYNIQNLVKESTITTKHIQDFSNQSKILKFLKNEKPGIVCLQELLYDRKGFKQFPAELGKQIGCKYYYLENYYPKNDNKKLDAIAIFSKFPIINNGFIKYKQKTIAIFADIVTPNDTIRVFNLHLASLHFRDEDYRFISEMDIQKKREEFRKSSGKILHKINYAFQKRGLQTRIIEGALSRTPYPVIICGDFNDTPASYTYRKISNGLADAFVESGSGFANTYAGKLFPLLRIDHILYDKSYSSINFKRHNILLSDHFPVSVLLFRKK